MVRLCSVLARQWSNVSIINQHLLPPLWSACIHPSSIQPIEPHPPWIAQDLFFPFGLETAASVHSCPAIEQTKGWVQTDVTTRTRSIGPRLSKAGQNSKARVSLLLFATVTYLLLGFFNFSAGPVNVPWQLDAAIMHVCHAFAPIRGLIVWLNILIRSRNLPPVNIPHRLDIPTTWKVAVTIPVGESAWHTTIELVRDEDGHRCWKHSSHHWHGPSVAWSKQGSEVLALNGWLSGRKKLVCQSCTVESFENQLLVESSYC